MVFTHDLYENKKDHFTLLIKFHLFSSMETEKLGKHGENCTGRFRYNHHKCQTLRSLRNIRERSLFIG